VMGERARQPRRPSGTYWFDGVHLMAPTLDELHAVAEELDMPRSWFQDHLRHPHYDVWGHRARRLQINRTTREMLRAWRQADGNSDDNDCRLEAGAPGTATTDTEGETDG